MADTNEEHDCTDCAHDGSDFSVGTVCAYCLDGKYKHGFGLVRWTPKTKATPPADAALGDAVAPGVMRCAKCKFGLQRVILSVRSGTASAGNSKTEPCPNGCGPLWPVTWKELAKEHLEVAERFFDESAVLRKDNETLRAELTALRARQQAVPKHINAVYFDVPAQPRSAYVMGWNDCIDSMLAASQSATGGAK